MSTDRARQAKISRDSARLLTLSLPVNPRSLLDPSCTLHWKPGNEGSQRFTELSKLFFLSPHMHFKVSIHMLKGPTAAVLYLDDAEISHGVSSLFMTQVSPIVFKVFFVFIPTPFLPCVSCSYYQ